MTWCHMTMCHKREEHKYAYEYVFHLPEEKQQRLLDVRKLNFHDILYKKRQLQILLN